MRYNRAPAIPGLNIADNIHTTQYKARAREEASRPDTKPMCAWVSTVSSSFFFLFAAVQVGDRGAQALAIALPTLGLETLDVGFSHVGTAGVAALMQVGMLLLT